MTDVSQNRTNDDPFDSILFPEDKFCKEGYEAGLDEGRQKGLAEGFAAGWQQGCKLGEEIGFFRGFAESWLETLTSGTSDLLMDDRKLKVVYSSLKQLQKMAGGFEICNINTDAFTTELSKIRAKFKQVVTQMGLKQFDFGKNELSF
ncbi:protein LTO1 homolog isoform X2 [Dysidea avara]|uniref:protein LTO1 homolog isoform X2 n=1 Tax=Dysidea avara TaxID=196820 RepID=UPI0033257697